VSLNRRFRPSRSLRSSPDRPKSSRSRGWSVGGSAAIAAIESGVPLQIEAREIISSFQAMTRRKCATELEPWLEREHAQASSPSSPMVSSWTRPPSAPPSSHPGQTAKLKARSPRSSSSNAKCTAEENSTCSKPASSAPRRAASTKSASEPILNAGPRATSVQVPSFHVNAWNKASSRGVHTTAASAASRHSASLSLARARIEEET
jgi:hypothetical protein